MGRWILFRTQLTPRIVGLWSKYKCRTYVRSQVGSIIVLCELRLQGIDDTEDDPGSRQLLQTLLKKRESFKLLVARNAKEAKEIATTFEPDLFLLDINLPGENGLSLFEFFKKKECCKHSRFVALSANSMPDQVNQAMDLGFDKYLSKPVDLAQIPTEIQTASKS